MKNTLLFSILFVFPVMAGKTADFVIISTPAKLSIFNQFEQALTEKELNSFATNTPFEIVNRKETLGDQITDAMRCKNQGSTFYILLDNKGAFKNAPTSLYQKFYTKCTVLYDTVQLKRETKISDKYPSGSTTRVCKPDQILVRIFQQSGFYYVFVPQMDLYGWIAANPSLFKTKEKISKIDNTFSVADIEHIVLTRLTAANQDYQAYFGYFNTLTQQDKSIPIWKLENDGKRLHCKLSGSSPQVARQLQQSTRYIVQDIEQMLLGKPFAVQYSSDEITITLR